MDTNWVELYTTVLTLMDNHLETLNMDIKPWLCVREKIVTECDICIVPTKKYPHEVFCSTFLNGCANENSGSSNLRLIAAPHTYGPIRNLIAQYYGAV